MPQPCSQPVHHGKRNAIKSIAVLSFSAGGAAFLSACSKQEKPQFKSIDLTGADYAKGFSLPDQNGKLRSMKDFAGKIVVVFFGFTQCPDVCPTSMVELAQVKKALGQDGDKLQVVFITVDPERDTPGLLKAYMTNFDPSFIAVRPGIEQLPQLAKDYKIYYKKVDGKTPASYTMEHSAGNYVYDPKGNIRLYSRYGNDVQGLTADLRLLLKNV